MYMKRHFQMVIEANLLAVRQRHEVVIRLIRRTFRLTCDDLHKSLEVSIEKRIELQYMCTRGKGRKMSMTGDE